MNLYKFNNKINNELSEGNLYELIDGSIWNSVIYFKQTNDIKDEDFNNLTKEQLVELYNQCYELKDECDNLINRFEERLNDLDS